MQNGQTKDSMNQSRASLGGQAIGIVVTSGGFIFGKVISRFLFHVDKFVFWRFLKRELALTLQIQECLLWKTAIEGRWLRLPILPRSIEGNSCAPLRLVEAKASDIQEKLYSLVWYFCLQQLFL